MILRVSSILVYLLAFLKTCIISAEKFFDLPAIHTISAPDWWTVIDDRFYAINAAGPEQDDDESDTEREPSVSKYFEYSISEGKRKMEKELINEVTDVSNYRLRKAGKKLTVIIIIYSVNKTAGLTTV